MLNVWVMANWFLFDCIALKLSFRFRVPVPEVPKVSFIDPFRRTTFLSVYTLFAIGRSSFLSYLQLMG